MSHHNQTDAFFALLRAGLWERSFRVSEYEPVDFSAVYELAEKQSVIGLIAAGLEMIEDRKVVKQEALPYMQSIIATEAQNAAMNAFIGELVGKMRAAGIHALLIKGQGVAQCYSRPEWRSPGDVDLFLDAENYGRAKDFLKPMAVSVEKEDVRALHQGMTIGSWLVELHGRMHTDLSNRINAGVDEVQKDIFEKNEVRVWNNGGVDVLLPSPDNDVIIIFTHFIQHFFVAGIGLRQIADWCRLLWTYRDTLDRDKLCCRLDGMGLMTEWKAFASFAVSRLGMPADAMPFHDPSTRYSRKAALICKRILKTGNFGHCQDNTYRSRYPKLVEKTITFFRRLREFIFLTRIFPWDGPRFFLTYVIRRTKAL